MVEFRDPGPVEFDAVVLRDESVANSGAWVAFPFSVAELFGVTGRVPVRATFDGVPYRGSLARMGGEQHLLGVLKAVREATGKQPGDVLHVVVRLDTDPRTVELGPDARAALEAAGATAAFTTMSYSHQREYQQWIDSAVREATRAARIERMVGMVREGRRLK
ncbi:YdeI/OmpD-associated family protein [Herbiconiux moechotypicola]|uniref:DUF1905 domain-containing protein n=1 Tax=Herbiconiux moechotypicola TaxID=637393 RepID=A0ABN3DVW1_9MICO|nr:YdeI/OmpD-associated family protein [Herbiconiux moechotypicola]MCS5730947.1 YdeI/OmpD-associated family protein [Herbiconiux moechotypicola]